MDQKIKYSHLLIGLVTGVLITLLVSNTAVNSQNYGMMQMMGMRGGVEHMMKGDGHTHEDEGMMSMMHEEDEMNMRDMVDELNSLSGEEFDREFVRLMIEHHQGAIDMAELIPVKTGRQELRDMGEDIINAQTREIEMMTRWLDDWAN